jgi:hypothetical protein
MLLYVALTLAACVICVLATLLVVKGQRRVTGPVEHSDGGSGQDQEALAPPRRVRAIKIRDGQQRELLELRLPDGDYLKANTWTPVQLKIEDKGWLEPLIAEAMKTFDFPLLAGLRSSHTFEVAFHGGGHLMRAADGDGYRAILVGDDNKIVEHARLRKAAGLIRADLIWECAALITQRKFLVDIDKKLGLIDSGIAELKSYFRNERVARLQAGCLSLTECANALKNDPSALYRQDFLQHAAEEAERDAREIARTCLLDLQTARIAVEKINLNAILNADLEPISREMEAAVFSIKSAAFALEIRNFAAAISANYIDDSTTRVTRSDDVLSLYKDLNSESLNFQQAFRERIDTMRESLSFKETILEKQRLANSQADAMFTAAARILKVAKVNSEAISEDSLLMPAAKGPIHLQIKVNRSGKLLAASVAKV